MGQFTKFDQINPKTWFYFYARDDKTMEDMEEEGIVYYLKFGKEIKITYPVHNTFNCISANGDFDYACSDDIVIPLENPVQAMNRFEDNDYKWELLTHNLHRLLGDARKEKIKKHQKLYCR